MASSIARAGGGSPLLFEANHGQIDGHVAFVARSGGSTLFLARDRITIAKAAPWNHDDVHRDRRLGNVESPADPPSASAVSMVFVGANPEPTITGEDQQPTKVNYYVGNDPARWQSDVPTFARVEYKDVYPGIDLAFYGGGAGPEHDWIVHPGADAGRIHLRVEGAPGAHLARDGRLTLPTTAGDVIETRPAAYQPAADGRRPTVVADYHISGTGDLTFTLGRYDAGATLVIDPAFVFSTYLGAESGASWANAVTTDNSGNVYITGASQAFNYATTSGAFQTNIKGTRNAVITKLSADGRKLLYSTYIGGAFQDEGLSLSVDTSGGFYVGGYTFSSDFPQAGTLVQTKCGGGPSGTGCWDGWAAHFDSSGHVVFSTFIGGSNADAVRGVATEPNGNVVLTGFTDSSFDFPTFAAMQSTSGCTNSQGCGDLGFLTELSPTGVLLHSAYLEGAPGQLVDANGIAVDSAGAIYIGGETQSPTQFATAGAAQTACLTAPLQSYCDDGFIMKIAAGAASIVYTTYIGGSYRDWVAGIAVDGSGDAFVTGVTQSPDFPTTTGAFQRTCAGKSPDDSRVASNCEDGFVAKLNPSGSAFVYSTYIGGSNDDVPDSIAVDASGGAYVVGTTESVNFPLARPMLNRCYVTIAPSNFGKCFASFAAHLGSSGGSLDYSTYLGDNVQAYGAASGPNGNLYVAGQVSGGPPSMPAVSAYQPINSSTASAFIMDIQPQGSQAALNGGAVTKFENTGGWNLCWACSVLRHQVQSWSADPVNDENGGLTEVVADMIVAGRGIPLDFTRTYSAINAGTAGPIGYGWTFGERASLSQDASSNVTIAQENGSLVVFNPSGTGFVPSAPRITASLAHNSDGTWTLSRANRELLVFSAAGRLIRHLDRNGYPTTLNYNSSGQLGSVTDESSRSLTFGYTGSMLTTVTDPVGRVVTFGYNDGLGNLTDVNDVNGGHTHYTYDGSHRLLTTDDPVAIAVLPSGSHQITNVYDASGRVGQQTIKVDPSDGTKDRVTTFSYTGDPTSASGGTTTITDPKGNVTVEQYAYGVRTSLTKGYGTAQAATWTFAYDPSSLALILETDPNGHQTVRSSDGNGNILMTADGLARTATYRYDSANDLLSATDPNRATTTMQYDANGNLTSRSTPPVGNGTPEITSYQYSDKTHPGDQTATIDPTNQTWPSTYYGTGGYLKSSSDPLGHTTSYTYNAIGWKTSQTTPRGNVTGCLCSALYTTTYSYNDSITAALDGFGDVRSITDARGNHTLRSYDADRNQVYERDGKFNVTQYRYDLANERTDVLRADGTSLHTDYNRDGTVLDERDGGLNSTAYAYDPLAHRTTITDPLNRVTSTTYDGTGNRRTLVDPQNQTTTYSYDSADELVGITYSDGTTPKVTNIQYDGDGRRTLMDDGTGESSWNFDAVGRLTSTFNGAGLSTAYSYDLANRVTQVTYPGNHVVQRGYDTAGRLTSVTDWLNHTTLFTPDEDSNTITEAYPNGITASLGYDPTDRLSGITDARGGSTVASFSYTRDGNNQLQSATTSGVPAPLSDTYGESQLNQLSIDVNSAFRAYGYDAADNPTRLDTQVQTFDAGNELKQSGNITLVDTASDGTATGTSLGMTVTLHIASAANDQILVASTQPTGISVSAPGYSQVANVSSGTAGGHTTVLRKTSPGGETQVALSYSALSARAAVVLVYRGVDPTAPIDAVGGGGFNLAATFVVAPSITTTVAGDRLVAFQGANGNAGAASWTADTTMTEAIQASTFRLVSAGAADQVLTAAGATGDKRSDLSQTANLESVLVALKPAFTNYSFDPRGNRISVTPPGTSALTTIYDQANRLIRYGATASYGYNGDGLRMSKTVGATTEQFTYDTASQGLPVPIADGSTDFVYGQGGQPLEQITPQTSISLVGTPSSNSVGALAASIGLPLPTGIQPNDQIVASVTYPAGLNNALTAPAGYAQVGSTVTGGGTAPTKTVVFHKTATASDTPGSQATFTFNGGGHFTAAGVLAAYRGVDPNNPIDLGALASAGSSSNTSSTVSAGPVTTVFPSDRMVIVQGGTYVGTVPSTGWTITGPTGQPTSVQEQVQANSTATVTAGLADQTLGNPGNLTPAYVSTAPTSGSLTTMLVPLKTVPAVLYFHQDQLGSTRLLTDQAGTVLAGYTHDAYGNLVGVTGTATTPLLWAGGQYRDAESGLYYMRARFFDPSTATWLTRDPLTSLSKEPYSYVSDNPLNGTDPSGLFGCGILQVVCDAAGTVGGGIASGAEWAWNNRGAIATAGAIGTCLAVSLGGCAIATGVALAVRVEQRIQSNGFSNSLGANALDVLVSGASFGILGVPANLGEAALEGLAGPTAAYVAALRAYTTAPDIIDWLRDRLVGGMAVGALLAHC